MNYYYDVVLSFNDEYYKFYEVDKNDIFEYIKKIPIFHVNNKIIKDLIFNDVKVNKDFLKIIYNKCICNRKKLEYVCLFADKNNCIAVEFDKNGNNIAKSCLSLTDELNIIEIIYTIKYFNLQYERLQIINYDGELRKEKEIKKIILMEVEKLCKEKDYGKLQYLYLEWFNVLCNDAEKIKNDIIEQLNKEIDFKAERIMNIIKMSYNNV